MSELKINDGGGLLDNYGMIDSLIVDCNELPKTLFEGQYVGFCAKIVEMVQKLSRLSEGIRKEEEDMKERLADVQRLNDDLAEKVYGLPVERSADGQGNDREDREAG